MAFVERLKRDVAFQSRLVDAPTPSERLAIAWEEGFDLSHDDVAAVRRALSVEELSDDDLERVAGGVGAVTGGIAGNVATAAAHL